MGMSILFATDPPYLVDYDGTNHPPNKTYKERQEKAKLAAAGKVKKGWLDGNKDWSDTYGVTWDDSSQGPELYEGFIRAAKHLHRPSSPSNESNISDSC